MIRLRLLLVVLGAALSGASPARGQQPFITTWRTTSADERVQIGTNGTGVSTYDFTIDWGDGTVEAITGDDPDPSHRYQAPGTYVVQITGTFPWLFMDGSTDSRALRSIEQWGDVVWESLDSAFEGTASLTINAQDTPRLQPGTSMHETFAWAEYLTGDLDRWDVSNVTDMTATFAGASTFNLDIGAWDVSGVTTMHTMFEGAAAFNQDLGAWDVSSVTDMTGMFLGAEVFNQDLGAWDVSNVTTMRQMFMRALMFNQDLGAWDVARVTATGGMFEEARSFNGAVGTWDVSNVIDMTYMFKGATSFDRPLGAWDVSNVVFMAGLFQDARTFDQPLNDWDVSATRNLSDLFRGAAAFNQPLGAWDVSGVNDVSRMFDGAIAFDQNLGAWDITDISDFYRFLAGAQLSTRNYDALLRGWAAQRPFYTDIRFDAGRSRYSDLGAPARRTLTEQYGWTILDGGPGEDDRASPDAEPRATLDAPHPHPTRGVATVRFELRLGADVSLALYDAYGRRVRTLVRGYLQPGRRDVSIPTDRLASGTYYLRLHAGDVIMTRPLTVVR